MSFGSKKQPSISIPQYSPPPPPTYKAFGLSADPSGSGYSLTMSGQEMADYNLAQKIRSELLSGLGLSGPSGGAKEYGDLITRESLRTAQPTLENALIGRGLGGSSIYKEALTDLISKAATQGTLSSADYVRNNLASLESSYFAPQYALGQNLLQLATSKNVNDQQLAQQLYLATLPYLSQINQPGNSGIGGAINGGITGLMMSGGNPFVALAGAGGGYLSSKSDPYSQSLYLYQLDQQNKASQNYLRSLLQLSSVGGNDFSKVFSVN